MNDAGHWDTLYASRPPGKLGWYSPHLDTSLAWIGDLDLDPEASTLVDDLLAAGHRNLTVLDLSAAAIRIARERAGEAAGAVTWLVGDVTEMELPDRHYRLWHDRAVFHFLVEPELQQRYRTALLGSLEAGGFFLVATFAPGAPPRCSGLPVRRYDAEQLARTFGDGFEPRRQRNETHTTPDGVKQPYVYCLLQRTA